MRSHLKSMRSTGLLVVIVIITFFAAACASGPQGTTPEVSCALLSSWDLGSYGSSYVSNPFMAPTSLLKGAPDEFVPLGLTLSLPEAATVNIDASVRNETGDVVARLYTLPEMEQYWSNWGDATDRTSRDRLQTLDRWYIPGAQIAAHKGRTEYVMVLMGKKPLPRPASVMVAVSINAGDPQMFTFPLPPKK
jgi:hypothetical protein